jgi:enoyl-CoA hydratase/carnithine racemase
MAYKFDKNVPYRTYLEDYRETWAELAHLRREDGILEVRFHWNNGPWRWNEAVHTALVPFCQDISQDPENECIIITGTGDSFLDEFDAETVMKSDSDHSRLVTYDWWWRAATRVPGAIIDIPVPVISAINGAVSIHPEFVLLADIVIASDKTTIIDRHLQEAGVTPTDGINILYEKFFGANLARSALYLGTEISAERALNYGVFAEVLPADKVLERAWELARTKIMTVPRIHRRMSREALIQPFREAFAKYIRASLAHECYAAQSMPGEIPHGKMLKK